MAGAADAIGNLFNVTSKTFRTCECFMYLEKGEVHREQKEGYMTPPREPWAALKALLRLFRMQATRPTVMVGAGRGGAAIECPALSERGPAAVEDSSDLLKRRMRALHLDPDDLDRAPARFTGIKTGLCSRCEARGRCMRDLDEEFADLGWGDWRNYCPNATTLSILSTLHECEEQHSQMGRAAQQAV
jgi:hypothetical protein